MFLVRDCVWVLKLIPLSNAVVLANWLPVAAGLLAGIAWRLIPGRPLRRRWPVIALGFAGLFALVQPLVGRPPACQIEHTKDFKESQARDGVGRGSIAFGVLPSTRYCRRLEGSIGSPF